VNIGDHDEVHFRKRAMRNLESHIEKHGFACVQRCISSETVAALERAVDAHQHGVRNLLSNSVIQALARTAEVRGPVAEVLGGSCFAVRGIFCNKNPFANWKVSWHQDCVIAVREKVEIDGWGPWSRKAGVTHVRPAANVLRQMLAIRIHLDDCGKDNGPLRVLPGAHDLGILSDEQVQQLPKEEAVTCSVQRGDAVLMRPLLLHASSPALKPTNRRVIHLEFAARELPGGAEWYERVSALGPESA
jgi:ectoine hydroxylase-related dioxygenase (phytanoyl-CoA dioxygenase family)